jgi:protein gp37
MTSLSLSRRTGRRPPEQWQSWNPLTGCTRISEGCRHCYAERFAERWRGIPGHHYEHGFDLQLRPERLGLPLRWKKPRRVFVDSMGDLFHEHVPDDYVRGVFAVMERAPRHVFHVLTKRADRMLELAPSLPWPANVWMGVTVERGDYAWRADALRKVPATRRHLSAEPLLGALDTLDLSGIHLVIAGGESGLERRPPQPDWLRGLRDRCVAAHVAFSFKGWGGRGQHDGGRLLDGRVWDECPSAVPVAPQPTRAASMTGAEAERAQGVLFS